VTCNRRYQVEIALLPLLMTSYLLSPFNRRHFKNEIADNENSSLVNGPDHNCACEDDVIISQSEISSHSEQFGIDHSSAEMGQDKSIETCDHIGSTRFWKKVSVSMMDIIIHHHRNITDTVGTWRRTSSTGSPLSNGCDQKAAIAIGYNARKSRVANVGNYASANMLDDDDMEDEVENNRKRIETLRARIKEEEAAVYGETGLYLSSSSKRFTWSSGVYDKISDDDGRIDLSNESDEYISGLLKSQKNTINQLNEELLSLRMDLSCQYRI